MKRADREKSARRRPHLDEVVADFERAWEALAARVADSSPQEPSSLPVRRLARFERNGAVVVVFEIPQEACERWRKLSPREREVAGGVARGKTSGEIARELEIAEKTVKTHLAKVFLKLDVSTRSAVAALAILASRALDGS